MKKLTVWATATLLICSAAAVAAKPVNIKYTGRKTTFFGTEYKTYLVRCSDGSTKQISAWKKDEWCVNEKRKQCFSTQIHAANAVCNTGN